MSLFVFVSLILVTIISSPLPLVRAETSFAVLPHSASRIVSYAGAPSGEGFQDALTRKQVELERIAEEARKAKEREDKIQRLLAYLKKKGSPAATYEIATIVIDKSAANGADWRVVMAIAGAESGFCKQSFWHNCFGYLNGVKYPSYAAAFTDLVPKVSRQYAARYGWDFAALAKAYGQQNWEHSTAVMRKFASEM